MYAIVDIETTGGNASSGAITEIAVEVHDGLRVIDSFHSLVNPGCPIPEYIQALTGISPQMVEHAHSFGEIAPMVYSLLEGNVFVAHNVNFDYSFIKFYLEKEGIPFHAQKLCTLRLSRKIFPGFPSYSLGDLCRRLGIRVEQRHRALGDACATVELFSLLMSHDLNGWIPKFRKQGSGDQYLPLHLALEEIQNLPSSSGVYYFHDKSGKIIYVGKANNIQKRVKGHFTYFDPGLRRQKFLLNIYHISYFSTPGELEAKILECIEIRRIWPRFNRAQKGTEPKFGIYVYEDFLGMLHLVLDKVRKNSFPILTFFMILDGQEIIRKMAKRFGLCPKYCFLGKPNLVERPIQPESCPDSCRCNESVIDYNHRVRNAIEWSLGLNPTFAIVRKGLSQDTKSWILMEGGKFFGMGDFSVNFNPGSIDEIKRQIPRYPDHYLIRNLILDYSKRFPSEVIFLDPGKGSSISSEDPFYNFFQFQGVQGLF